MRKISNAPWWLGTNTYDVCLCIFSRPRTFTGISRKTQINCDHIFPGYEKIALTLAQLKNIILEKEYPEWKKMLSAVNCIYIITDRKTGKNYIGSTYGKEGIWGRWKEYAKTGGHGNNVTLQKLYDQDNSYPNNFSWSILETLSISISSYEAINIEKCYKQKLGTLAFGLNNN